MFTISDIPFKKHKSIESAGKNTKNQRHDKESSSYMLSMFRECFVSSLSIEGEENQYFFTAAARCCLLKYRCAVDIVVAA